jgi:DNA-binding NarL/FixJ family response regulator
VRERADDQPPARILVADDAEEMRAVVRLALENAGVGVVVGEAADGEQVLRLVAETEPDLVLLDLSMPPPDGLELLALLHDRTPRLRVLVLSGADSPGHAERAVAAGALGYVVKGGPLRDLVGTVREALARPVG